MTMLLPASFLTSTKEFVMKHLKLTILALAVISLFLFTGCAPKRTMSNLIKEDGYSEQKQDPFDRDSMMSVSSLNLSEKVDPNYSWKKSLTLSPGDLEKYSRKFVTWRIEEKSYFSDQDEFNEVAKSIHPLVQKHLQENKLSADALYYYTLKSFAFDKDIVTSDMKEVMKVVLNDQKTKNIEPLLLVGYADEVGTEDYNVVLSEARAQAIKAEFEKLGLSTSNLKIFSGGETTEYGSHEENRRGILVVIVKD